MLYKSVILLILGFLPIASHAQIQTDTFRKYSYHITGMLDNEPLIGGTAFFIKHSSKYYVASAWHCFTFKNYLTETFETIEAKNINNIIVYKNLVDIHPDKFMRIKIKDTKIGIPIYFEKRLNDTLVDVSAIEVQRNSPFEFDYIDFNSIDTSNIEINDSIFYYGFPVLKGHQVDTANFYSGNVIQVDKNRCEFTIRIQGHTGCSGSPVFRIKDGKISLKGVLYYALKDNTGKAFLCKAIDIRQLTHMLK